MKLHVTPKKSLLVWVKQNDQIDNAIKSSKTRIEVLRKLEAIGPSGGGWYRMLNDYIRKFNVDISHFSGAGWAAGMKFQPKPRIPDSEIFIENKQNGVGIRGRYLRLKEIPYACTCCGLSTWQDKKISLQLDHIDGNHSNNLLTNLRWLCPNCHSQTATFNRKKDTKPELYKRSTGRIECLQCGKLTNGKKYCSRACYRSAPPIPCTELNTKIEKLKLSYSVVLQQVKDTNYQQVGKLYGVTGAGIKKWLQRHELLQTMSVVGVEPTYPIKENAP